MTLKSEILAVLLKHGETDLHDRFKASNPGRPRSDPGPVIEYLKAHPYASPTKIANALGAPRSTVQKVLARLDAEGED